MARLSWPGWTAENKADFPVYETLKNGGVFNGEEVGEPIMPVASTGFGTRGTKLSFYWIGNHMESNVRVFAVLK